jgi:hypothetical protein
MCRANVVPEGDAADRAPTWADRKALGGRQAMHTASPSSRRTIVRSRVASEASIIRLS